MGKYTQCALVSCNVSFRREISQKDIIGILQGVIEPNTWFGHIDVFFNELPKKIFLGFLQENNISLENAKIAYSNLPKALQGKHFLEICSDQ